MENNTHNLISGLLGLSTYDLVARNWNDEMQQQRPLDLDDVTSHYYGGGEWVRMEDVLEILKKHGLLSIR
jgi:hypothetical protein